MRARTPPPAAAGRKSRLERGNDPARRWCGSAAVSPAWLVGRVLGQVIGDFFPNRLRGGEDVRARTFNDWRVNCTEPDAHIGGSGRMLAHDGRATVSAKVLDVLRARFIARQCLGTVCENEVGCRDHAIDRESAALRFATSRAVAIDNIPDGAIDRESNRPTEATPRIHAAVPANPTHARFYG